MKKNKRWRCVSVFTLVFLCFLPFFAQNREDPRITETVDVVNVEVPVRVFFKGELVKNLTRKDFTLYEGDEAQVINGFYSRKRSLKVQDIRMKPGRQSPPGPGRYIVLIFRITDFNKQLEKGMAYLFNHIITPKDQLLVFINEKTISLNKSFWHIDRQDILTQIIQDECLKAHQRLIAYFLKIQKELDRTRMRLIEDDTYGRNTYFIMDFLKRYLETWQEYKKKYLIPDLDKYYNFAKHLDKINKQKWILNFYQIEMFPKLRITGRLRQQIEQMISQLMVARSEDAVHSQIISRLLDDIDTELSVADDFPIDEITKLMYKVDTTFHSIFMGVEKETMIQDFQFKRVSTDIENCLREVTKKTGGALISSGDLGSALHSIKNKQDFFYVLTYVPLNPKKIEKIKITVKNKKYDVVYDDNFRADYINEYLAKRKAEIPPLTLAELAFKENRLSMSISDFKMSTLSKKKSGKLNIRVRMIDGDNQTVFDQKRLIEATREIIQISIHFEFLPVGKYKIIIDVSDLLTGKTAMDFLDSACITQ